MTCYFAAQSYTKCSAFALNLTNKICYSKGSLPEAQLKFFIIILLKEISVYVLLVKNTSYIILHQINFILKFHLAQ